jgi:hypothetical protein
MLSIRARGTGLGYGAWVPLSCELEHKMHTARHKRFNIEAGRGMGSRRAEMDAGRAEESRAWRSKTTEAG